ncbi:MAG: DUF429 domain-containing protein [Betaproteobacteria bacterium]|nr:DUF429 domain-containing protein [Betaproteobacteria bacterium]
MPPHLSSPVFSWAEQKDESFELIGVDFTSAPSARKPITAARGRLSGNILKFEALENFPDWPSFEKLLQRPGPWLGAFDFPFGLPREGVFSLGWPLEWAALVRHCHHLGKTAFRAALDTDRQSRAKGSRYPHRATDRPAVSHSPFKLVNPPVGLMFLAGAPRLLAAGLHLPGQHSGDPMRIALEAYPGLLARAIATRPYKSDELRKQTSERAEARRRILTALKSGKHPLCISLQCSAADSNALIADARGDQLDAVLALIQAGWAWQQRKRNFGLPDVIDPIEGWILGAPYSL